MKTISISVRKSPFLVSSVVALFLCGGGWATTSEVPAALKESNHGEFPDGFYEYHQVTDGDWYHFFLIYPKGDKSKAIKTPSYGRRVELIPSPDHAHFVINHHGGSNFSYPIIFRLPKEGKPQAIVAQHKKKKSWQVEDDDLTPLFWDAFRKSYNLDVSFGHHYVEVLTWLDNDTVLLGAQAHSCYSPGKSERESTNVYVSPFWCQLYSLKTGKMSSDLNAFNKACRCLPERVILPNSRELTIAFSQPKAGEIEKKPGAQIEESQVSNQTIALPKEEGGQVFAGFGKGKTGGLIRSTYYSIKDDQSDSLFYKYIISNGEVDGDVASCILYESNNDGRFNKKTNIRDLFMKHVGWEKDAFSEVYALVMIGESTFVVQGIARDKDGKQLSCKTLLFDASNNTFSEDLSSWNDTRVHLFTPQN